MVAGVVPRAIGPSSGRRRHHRGGLSVDQPRDQRANQPAGAWVRAAFSEFGLRRLTAFTHPENRASLRVLEKLGFCAEGYGTSPYWIFNQEFL
ncbi:GNAT family N-acetyltransferase [candidate division KSB1 bacterium]|nr:GNAT family N-acetyltransferase [candidate division KSB1 bacterium]NIV69625.1 GNAT family N-acetyltransferase [Phycisphaerae bacterium]NIR70365.1 GNAT family N-acetyltransferase [candidate division KSB1 bacterium]NIS24489.1 GNAT family N-acetyltransferase [candidate division KSB1 bacterium]NIT71417.1 GNAT family N-acetyltransferase [candidate division KSB1 bacterium]